MAKAEVTEKHKTLSTEQTVTVPLLMSVLGERRVGKLTLKQHNCGSFATGWQKERQREEIECPM